MVGSQAVDGDFGRFTTALGVPDFGEDGVSYRTRHGVTLALDWDGPFTPDGRPAEPLHLDNPLVRLPFGASEMVIGEGPHRHVIDLQWGRPVD